MGLAIAFLIRNGCTAKTATVSAFEASPSPVEITATDCLGSLSKVRVKKDEDKSFREAETEGDNFEVQGKGQEALNKYSEAYLLYLGELGYATGRALRGDVSASMEINASVRSPEFPFKVGRAAAKAGNHKMAKLFRI